MSESTTEVPPPSTDQVVLAELLAATAAPEPAKPTQPDLFYIGNVVHDWPVKDDVSSMEHPIFALSKKPVTKVREYSRGGKVLRVIPSVVGAPTIFDKDLMIYIISQLAAATNAGKEVTRCIRMNVTEFLKGTHRSTGGASYERVVDMCRRLAGARIETNIRTTEDERTKGFGMLEEYDVISYTKNGKGALELEVVISEWIWRSVMEFDILTLNPEYFKLGQALERRVYELARKHCGMSQMWWAINLELLREKVGSEQSPRKWKQEIKAMAADDGLPDYHIALDESVKPNQVVFFSRNHKKLMEAADKAGRIEWLSRLLQRRMKM